MKQTQEHLQTHLAEQLDFLRQSAELYDRGSESEAKRLAVIVRTLVHNTSKSRSLLSQLDGKTRDFYDTAVAEFEENLLGHGDLVQMFASPSGSKFIAPLDGPLPDHEPRWTPFEEWWNRVVFRTQSEQKLSRRSLILALANQDGGAHVDPELDASYAAIARENALGWEFSDGKFSAPIRAPELAAGRQIAHEVIKTFDPSHTKTPNLPSFGVVMGGSAVFQMSEDEARKAKRKNPETLPAPRPATPKAAVGRNAMCPCGSGKKFKKCHGR